MTVCLTSNRAGDVTFKQLVDNVTNHAVISTKRLVVTEVGGLVDAGGVGEDLASIALGQQTPAGLEQQQVAVSACMTTGNMHD